MFGVSLLAAAPVLAQPVTTHAEIAAAETNLNLSVGFLHTDYSEGQPDSETGFTPGFGIGASVLLPSAWSNIDYYSAFSYAFSAGNISYSGHYLFAPNVALKATDRAVFNHIEGRMGLGFPLAGGIEAIPFISAGYQSWNRNIDNKGTIGTDEYYSSAMAGGGVKLDIPVTATLVASGTAEMEGMFAGHISFDSFGIGHAMGNSAQERVSLGLDEALSGPLHFQASADVTHFNYAGSKPTAATYGLFEPASTTTQVGVNLGISYSF